MSATAKSFGDSKRHQKLFDIGPERCADAVRRGATRCVIYQALASWCPPITTDHVGGDANFIEEHAPQVTCSATTPAIGCDDQRHPADSALLFLSSLLYDRPRRRGIDQIVAKDPGSIARALRASWISVRVVPGLRAASCRLRRTTLIDSPDQPIPKILRQRRRYRNLVALVGASEQSQRIWANQKCSSSRPATRRRPRRSLAPPAATGGLQQGCRPSSPTHPTTAQSAGSGAASREAPRSPGRSGDG